jgi:hypothetical protein
MYLPVCFPGGDSLEKTLMPVVLGMYTYIKDLTGHRNEKQT